MEALDKANRLRLELAATGYYVKSLAGKPCLHPLVKVEESARKEVASLWDRLGLCDSPILENKYKLADADTPGVGLPDPDELDAMLREMKAETDFHFPPPSPKESQE